MSTEIVLVAFEVEGEDEETRAQVMRRLEADLQVVLKSRGGVAECWWVAEDDRQDGSDNDTAVFVHPGAAQAASLLLWQEGLTGEHNIVRVRSRFEAPENPL